MGKSMCSRSAIVGPLQRYVTPRHIRFNIADVYHRCGRGSSRSKLNASVGAPSLYLYQCGNMVTIMTVSGGSTYHASDGAAYELFLGRWTRLLAPRFIDFANFAADGALLDVGTGTGSLAFAMAARWPSRPVVGVDIAGRYVEFARLQPAPPLLSFEVGDASHLRHEDQCFSGSAAQLVLNFVPGASAAVRQMRRVTR